MAMVSQETHNDDDDKNDRGNSISTPDARLSSDRLSGLQESTLYHIFSFLGANATISLSLVSRKFKQLCLCSPFLFFLADFDNSLQISDSKMKKEILKTRYTQFCSSVDKVMRSRHNLGIQIDRFLIHWITKVFVNEGCCVIASWVNSAAGCNVRELDILIDVGFGRVYYLPDGVFECQSLKVLRLNLQKGNFGLTDREMESVDELVLDSVTIFDRNYGKRSSNLWASLKRLNLVNVRWMDDLIIASKSLEELKISNSQFGLVNAEWRFLIPSLTLKSISISRCLFIGPCQISLDCPSLENFTVHGSKFDNVFIVNMVPPSPEHFEGQVFWSDLKKASATLKCFGIFGSNFKKTCSFCISCPSVDHIKISSCKFEEFCHLKIDSPPLQDLTISDCELISPLMKISNPDHKRRIIINTEIVEQLTLISSDEYSYEFPLTIAAPNIQTIRWKGNPVDFSYLESFMSLKNAVIDIEPSCQHKSRELACCCKLFKSSIYSVAVLLQSLKHARFLKINIWPIEMFFMQNDEPIYFDSLVRLILIINDSLAEKLPVIASFLKGLPNLRILFIKCEKKSHALGNPNLINSLGLCQESFNLLFSEDWKKIKIEKITAQAAEEV
ncbi:conserved hypothetical protein [Ricinus communis]|uniref:F-box domain-containing protein n=2 Tax=Ricinus communis TaxID=3988 RepID=B9RS73_RICCO|nr:conserved hypothetical protein [Ricinus communis]